MDNLALKDPDSPQPAAAYHFLHSSLREKVVEHVFIGELSRCLWRLGIHEIEILRPETDFAGYDLAIECRGVLRHVQLKSSHRAAKTSRVAVQTRLAEKPSGCVIWIYFDDDLALGPLLWFGGDPGAPIPSLGDMMARHTKGDRTGYKRERPNLRVIQKHRFVATDHIGEIANFLFGLRPKINASVSGDAETLAR